MHNRAPHNATRLAIPHRWLEIGSVMTLLGVWVLLSISVSTSPSSAETLDTTTQEEIDRAKRPDALAQEAESAYQRGDYQRALTLYPLLLEQGIRNGHIYYNLGNAHQRAHHLGQAIYNYRRAALYLPRDGDVEANLAYARKQVLDEIEAPPPSLWQRLFFWHDYFSDFELLIGCVLFNTMFWMALYIHRRHRFPLDRWLILVSGVGALVSGGTGLERAWNFDHTPDGVVLEQELTIRSGTDVNSVPLFILHEGAEVHTRQQTGSWIQIELSDGKRGWTEKKFLGLITP